MSSIDPPKPKYRYNPEPRLSANQLAEYLKASPPRRKQIVKAAKFPKTVIVAQYKGARDALAKFLCDTTRDQKTLVAAVEVMAEKEAKATASDWVKDDARRSIEAITSFQKNANAMGVQKLDCKPIVTGQPLLHIAGVDVSVSLDATVRRLGKDGTDLVGGVIFLLSKADEASAKARAERCRVSAVLAYLFAKEHLGYLGTADPKLCYSFDVMAGKATQAPAAHKTLIDHMNDSCEEVVLRWKDMAPPDDYDGPAWQ